MPRSARIAGLLGAVALFAIVAGAYALTSSADTAEACRYRTGCDDERHQRDECDVVLTGVSTRDDCRPEEPDCEVTQVGLYDECCQVGANFENDPCEEPPTCIEDVLECCEIPSGTFGSTDLCEPDPCDTQTDVQTSQECCLPIGNPGSVSFEDECCQQGGVGGASIDGDCCEVAETQISGECDPPCIEELSISSGECGCMTPRGVGTSTFGCEPPRDERCELRSFRRIGHWPEQVCGPF